MSKTRRSTNMRKRKVYIILANYSDIGPQIIGVYTTRKRCYAGVIQLLRYWLSDCGLEGDTELAWMIERAGKQKTCGSIQAALDAWNSYQNSTGEPGAEAHVLHEAVDASIF